MAQWNRHTGFYPALSVLGVLTACSGGDVSSAGARTDELRIASIIESENLIEELRAPLDRLSKGVRNLRLPDDQGRSVFASEVRANDLESDRRSDRREILDLGVSQSSWRVSSERRAMDADVLSLWEPFLGEVAFFHHFGIYNVRGSFEADAKSRYRTDSGFHGLALLKSGGLAHVDGELSILWAEESSSIKSGEAEWRIAEFATETFELTEADRPLFVDVSDRALSGADRARIQRSQRDEYMIEQILGLRSGKIEVEEWVAQLIDEDRRGVSPLFIGQVAVVDVDRDGYDDLYLTSSLQQAMFFRNRGDGTFEEISAKLGLDLQAVHGALFADFDNDGDSDAFLSFYAEGTRYLRNAFGADAKPKHELPK